MFFGITSRVLVIIIPCGVKASMYRCRLAQNLVSHVLERGGSERLRMEVCIVELAIDLACFELSEGDLLFDIIENHFAYPESLLAIVTTALLSSMMIAGSSSGILSS